MKRSFLAVLLLSFILALFSTSALGYPTVFLKEVSVSPGSSETFVFPVLGSVSGVLYGQYNLAIDWDKAGPAPYVPISGFCVENAYSTTANGVVYELIPAPTFGATYAQAAWVLNQYLNHNISAQAAQIAIWELVLDPGNLNPTNGNGAFYATFLNSYVTEAYNFLTNGVGTYNGYSIAHSPVGSTNPTDPQDYIIPVPEPGILILLGIALSAVGLGAWRKRS